MVKNMENNYLMHYGVLGMKWGIRRYQNPDGSLTPRGEKHYAKKDSRWADRNYNRIYNKTYKKSKKEMSAYLKTELNPKYAGQKKGAYYVNEYNRKLAEVMNKNVGDIPAPSGKVVRFVAKRGEVGVHLALADRGYNMDKVRNGIYGSGRVAYKKSSVDMI